MNIGNLKANESGVLVGRITTVALALTIALRPVQSNNDRAPKFEILALGANRAWVQVGALFELTSNSTGEAFLQGKIDDPSMANPLYIACFRQDDGSYNVAWSRPTRRRDVPARTASADEMPPVPPSGSDQDARFAFGGADADGLGASTAPVD